MQSNFQKYRNKETGEIVTIKGFGTRFEGENAKTMVWIKPKLEEKASFIPARDFDQQYQLIENDNDK